MCPLQTWQDLFAWLCAFFVKSFNVPPLNDEFESNMPPHNTKFAEAMFKWETNMEKTVLGAFLMFMVKQHSLYLIYALLSRIAKRRPQKGRLKGKMKGSGALIRLQSSINIYRMSRWGKKWLVFVRNEISSILPRVKLWVPILGAGVSKGSLFHENKYWVSIFSCPSSSIPTLVTDWFMVMDSNITSSTSP